MHYFKSLDGSIHAIESLSSIDLLPYGCVKITDDEEVKLRHKPKPLTYAQLRAVEYPPYTDYLDGLVKGDAVQMQAYIDACLAVKAKILKS